MEQIFVAMKVEKIKMKKGRFCGAIRQQRETGSEFFALNT